MTLLTTLIFDFHKVVSSLMTPFTIPTMTPLLVKTSLKCETGEGLCAKARDFKLMCLIDYNNYLEGTRCFSRVAEGAKGLLKDVCLEVENL